jgi:hypothetical protein
MNIVIFVKAENAPGVSPGTSSANRSVIRTVNSSSFRRTVDAAAVISCSTCYANYILFKELYDSNESGCHHVPSRA